MLVSYFLGCPSKVVAGLGASTILVLTHVGSAVVLVLTGFIVIRGTIGGEGRARWRLVGVAIALQGGLLVADDVGNTIWRVSLPAR